MKKFLVLLLFINIKGYGQINPERIQIARDSFGVPHIFAPTDAEVAYGLAWAHAEDDIESLQFVILSGKAALGKALGKEGAEADYVVQLLRCRQVVEDQFHLLSPEFIKLIQGYIAGLNDYAKANPAKIKYKFAFPFDEKDYLTAVVFSISLFCGVDNALPQIMGGKIATIPGFSPEGSNGFAFHPSATTTGEAFLAVNAHQPLEGPMAFYEAHLNSEEGWNMLGGLLPGGPVIFHGTNENLGWAHMINYMDKIDIFQLKMHPDKKNYYEFDGEWIKLEENKAQLKVKGIPVTVGKKIWWSKYGATVKTKKGVFSMRLSANMDIRAVEQWYKMNKARNYSEFYQTLKMNAIPMFNIMYADRFDTIFYISNGKMPYRNPDKSYDWSSTLPGNTSATLWNKFKPVESFPQLVNPPSGYLFNTNHSPFLVTSEKYNLDPKNFDKNDGYETYHNNRSQRVVELMNGKSKIDYSTFKAIKFDRQLPQKLRYRYDIDTLMSMDPNAHPELKEIIIDLQRWDRRADTNSRGAAKFLLIYSHVVKTATDGKNRQLTKTEILNALQFVKQHLLTHFGRTDVTLGQVQRLVRGKEDFPAWGLPDVITPTYTRPYTNGRFKVNSGEAYVCLVRYPKTGLPIIETINTFGASMDPASPHFKDQLKMWQSNQLKKMSLDKQEVLEKAVRVYHPK